MTGAPPHCRAPEACRAKTAARACRSCASTARAARQLQDPEHLRRLQVRARTVMAPALTVEVVARRTCAIRAAAAEAWGAERRERLARARGRHPRLASWLAAFRAAGWRRGEVARLFALAPQTVDDLLEARRG